MDKFRSIEIFAFIISWYSTLTTNEIQSSLEKQKVFPNSTEQQQSIGLLLLNRIINVQENKN